MANLTGTLDTNSRGKSIIQGDVPEGGGFLSGLLNLGAEAVQGAAQKSVRADAQAAARQKAADRAALNATEGAVFEAMSTAADSLSTAKAGVNQGRVPPGTLQLQMEKTKATLFNQFPEQKAVIAKYMQERGFDDWEFRELNLQKDAEDAVNKAAYTADADDLKYAFDNGVGSAQNSDQQNIEAGRKQRAADLALDRAIKAADEARKGASENREQANFAGKQADQMSFGAINEMINLRINQFEPTIAAYFGAAVGDPDKEKRLSEIAPVIGNYIEQQRNAIIAKLGPNATPDLVKLVNDRFDTVKKSMEDRYSGPLSSVEAAKRTSEAIKTQFAIDNATALETYSQLSSVFGREVVNELFGNDLSKHFSKEVIDKMGKEIQGFRVADATEGRAHIMRLSALLKGETGLKDMSEGEAVKHMPALAGAARATSTAIVAGDHSSSAMSTYGNAYGNLVEAAVEVQPGRIELSSLWEGTKVLFSPRDRTALETMIKDPGQKDRGNALMFASRGAAQHVLEVARHSPSQDGFIKVVFDGNKYVAQFDQKAWQKSGQGKNAVGSNSLAMGGRLGPEVRMTEESARRVPQRLKDKINIMNATVEHLVETAKYDEDVPKGVTRKQLVEHYAKGTPFVSVNGKPMLSSDDEFFRSVDEFEAKLRKGAAGEAVPMQISDIKFGSDRDAAVRTALLEAAGEPREGQIGVLSAIINRQRSGRYGNTVADVVLANNGKTWQFEPWKTRAAEGMAIDPESKEYQEMAALWDELVSTNQIAPYQNFLNKDIVLERGDKIPQWAQGEGTKIGRHTFY